MNSLSAMGSSTAPTRELPKRRASIPSKKSDAAAPATSASRHAGEGTNGNATARGTRSAVSRSAHVTHGFTCPSLACVVASSRGSQSAQAGRHLPRPRRRRAGPGRRSVPGAEVRRRAVRVQGRGARQPVVPDPGRRGQDRKSTRLNSSHLVISYAVFCLKKKEVAKRRVEYTPSAEQSLLRMHHH